MARQLHSIFTSRGGTIGKLGSSQTHENTVKIWPNGWFRSATDPAIGKTPLSLKGLQMLGLCAMLLVLFAVTAVLSYWVSWELENKNTRPSFMTKLWIDCTGVLGRGRNRVAETRPASA
jgi:hypothetical protein